MGALSYTHRSHDGADDDRDDPAQVHGQSSQQRHQQDAHEELVFLQFTGLHHMQRTQIRKAIEAMKAKTDKDKEDTP